ncbi:MAG: thermosome subunit beta [Candidatus Bathyarchaeia archaeon]
MSTSVPSETVPVIILKEGTSRARGREAQHANIMAARTVAESLKTALGPRGQDKMLVDSFGDVTITNDGATILDEMDVQHPSAKMLVEAAKAQDEEVGDGTTSVVILTGELLDKAERLINKNVHPTIIIDGFLEASKKALEFLEEIAASVDSTDKRALKKVAMTSMSTKMVSGRRDFLADLAVDAVLKVAQNVKGEYRIDLDDIKLEKKGGESLSDTVLIDGVLIDKEVVHPGMPRRIEHAKIALTDNPLEIEKTEFDAKINIETPEQMQEFLQAEESMLMNMVNKIKETGANVLICQKGIDDVAQHFLARSGILAIRRVKKSDMEKLSKATGARVVTNIDDLSSKDLGYAKLVEERKVADDKMTFVEGCKNPRSTTILIRGGTDKIVDEAERSLHDALSVVRDVVIKPKVVPGGGAVEADLAIKLRNYAEGLSGKRKLAVEYFAESLESIPGILSENAGLDPIDMVSKLTARHVKGEINFGLDLSKGKIVDMTKINIIEPALVKEQFIKSATDTASMLLKIDDVIAAAKMKAPPTPPGGPSGGPPGGLPGGPGGVPPY